MEVCSGYDVQKYQAAWSTCPQGEIDNNPFRECRYVETFRSLSCARLVNARKWRCAHCAKLYGLLKRRATAAALEYRHPNTANQFLSEDQKLQKLLDQRHELSTAKKKMSRLQARMQQVLAKESITIEQSMSDALSEILKNSDGTPAQTIFLQQQVRASQQKNSCGMIWHPTMIRLALSIHLTSPAAYELLRQTGMVKLPSSRTLFDYSHVKPSAEGLDRVVIENLAERVSSLADHVSEATGKKETHKKYHTLMADEMYISQNLVFQTSTGKLLGYTSLDALDRELNLMEQYLDNPAHEIEETLATKVLVYTVKEVTNGIKEVVATYAVGDLSAIQMYVWTWKVLGALERSGIAVVAFVCDGSAVNRAFIRRHKPATSHPSGIVHDTWNKCARGRKLFFLSDVPHLLKTIRNCFLNSRWDQKKSRRKMMKNGNKISWDFIIKLYHLKQGKNLRKSYKLNAMNVYPDRYARMKVKYAGQVMSRTVSKDLRSQEWGDALEAALFIERVNDWFDCLNGAHTSVAKKTGNANLAAYTSTLDHRFKLLDAFLQYLEDWELEAQTPNISLNAGIASDLSRDVVLAECDESEIEEGDGSIEEAPASKRILSKQTLEGIRMTTLAFKPLVCFMLEEGASFINARVFTQDPLEQHFSKVRAGQGGSNNPDIGQILNRNRALHTIGQLGMKRKGNSGEDGSTVQVTTEPLPTRKCDRVPKFSS